MTTSPTQPDRNKDVIPAQNSSDENDTYSSSDEDNIDLSNHSGDEDDVPTDEDSVGSLVDFIVNGSVDESDVEDSEEEEEEAEYSDTSDEEEDDESYDPACDSDGSYHPPCQVEVDTDKPLRRSTRKRKVRQLYMPEVSDLEDDFE